MRLMTASGVVQEFDCRRWKALPVNATRMDTQGPSFVHDEYEAEFDGDFNFAASALFAYNVFAPHRMYSHVCTPNGRVAVGATIVQRVVLGRLAIESAVRVMEVEHTDTRAYFAYATLEGHPERGIASFELTRRDRLLTVKAEAWSRAGNPLSRLTRPLSRPLQRFITREAVDSFTELARGRPVDVDSPQRQKIEVMWDYFSFPVDEGLPISDELRTALQAWSDEWTEVMAGSDTRGFKEPADSVVEDFVERGRELARRLQVELGPEYEVTYYNEMTDAEEQI